MVNIIESGSKGNCTIVNDIVAIDIGVSFKKLSLYYKDLQLVLLTHIHGDHFNKSTIKRLSLDRPTLRFMCGAWLVCDLVELGVSVYNIDIFTFDTWNDYGLFKVNAFELFHNVENCGYKIQINDWKMIYATDTSEIKTEAENYDLYLIEANYEDEEIQARINQKIADGIEYIYEFRAMENHLSKRKADEFIYQNIGENGEYIYMHEHIESEA